jgi:hypothetical protein
MLGAAVLSVTILTRLAAVADASAAPPSGAPGAATDLTPGAVASEMVLPPVTEHALDPAIIPQGQPVSQQLVQRVELTIVGGPIELVTHEAVVTLTRARGSDEWTGVLPPVRLIDARGTHAGWSVHWTVTANPLPSGQLHLSPDAPVVVAGSAHGLVAGTAGPDNAAGETLFSARPGSGGGSYEAGGTLSLRHVGDVDGESIVIHLAFSLD